MVVADESKIQQEPNSCYRWNKRGNTPVVKVNRERKAVSIYGGLSRITKRVITHFCRWQESVETIAFLNKIKEHSNRLKKALNRTAPILLAWDGAMWHKSKEVKQWLADNYGVVELMNFPPYSPELNPQEKVWKALKKHLFDSLVHDRFDHTITKAKLFLRSKIFTYKFV